MKKIKALAIFNALSLIAHVALAYMTSMKLVNQKDVSEVAEQNESLFTPAGISFSIWGIIYITSGILCLYQL